MKYINEKVKDKIEQFYKSGKIIATNFLDPSEIVLVSGEIKYVKHVIWGGFECAERKVILIGCDFEVCENINSIAAEFISVLRISTSKGALSHRSVLGSVLGLGIKREMIGDIIVQNNLCDIIVSKNIAEYILNNFKFVGHEKIEVQEISLSEIIFPEDSSKEVKTTVASLRVDNIISAGYGISREKSSAFVKSEMVKLNHVVIKSAVKTVHEGDLISVRGKGRLEVREIGDMSKSGRIKIVLARK